MGRADSASSQDQAVYSYIQQTRLRGVPSDAASAVLLLNLIREVHYTLVDVVGPIAAAEAVERAANRSLAALPAQLRIS